MCQLFGRLASGREAESQDDPAVALGDAERVGAESSPVHGAFRAAVLGPLFTAGTLRQERTREPRSRGFSL